MCLSRRLPLPPLSGHTIPAPLILISPSTISLPPPPPPPPPKGVSLLPQGNGRRRRRDGGDISFQPPPLLPPPLRCRMRGRERERDTCKHVGPWARNCTRKVPVPLEVPRLPNLAQETGTRLRRIWARFGPAGRHFWAACLSCILLLRSIHNTHTHRGEQLKKS